MVGLQKIRRVGYQIFEQVIRRFNATRGLKTDPNENPAEAYYAKVYNFFMTHYIHDLRTGTESKKVLDVGCGTGRFAVDLAACGHDVTALDYTPDAIVMARQKAEARGVSLSLRCGNAEDVLSDFDDDSFDLIICFEMLYVVPSFREIMSSMVGLLKPGGTLACSHRPPHYFIRTLLRKGKYKAALRVTRSSEGVLPISKAPVYYNWQTQSELRQWYGELGLELMGLHAIGAFSGFGVDGMADIANPETMNDRDKRHLLELETEGSLDFDATGRYTIAMSRKSV
jgi:2-polyprenyl-3-methyl-5-hydroxy-6-metoxy-1,4-benzoquinol methylase